MEEKKTVEMTATELAAFEEFKRSRALDERKQKEKQQREGYRQLVDQEIDRAVPQLQEVSRLLAETKKRILDNFLAIIDLKGELLGVNDKQRSHTFTNSAGNMRLTIGFYVTDGYRDTVNDGIAIVEGYITSLAKDENARALVSMVLKLLAKDNNGTLKASRVIQLRKIAEETGSEEFLRGVTIIEEAYLPSVSKKYIKCETKTDEGQWQSVPLGMTEA